MNENEIAVSQSLQTVSEILTQAGLAQVIMDVEDMKLLVSMLKGRSTIVKMSGRTALREDELINRLTHQIHRLGGTTS
ncbi:hypothetical protein KNU14_gp19 [Gordonia phage Buggaboo]|uniref:Uncharacterized protein n=1 Tax=Gordonia phage Buggaboo TaxID=2315529 RepID=A0A386KFJ4_9CAUD|nr:hypothetical protein KNU14_gp19 [Gordonia phage Buggaboo]AVE00677.1 hypothetical protein SEA_SUPERSULLEY_19 [Gordonia phage SuperSulley]AYD83211.1 hypothetical protein SEA_BUGGABOO_19 [Gordonia phage Buggaboo]